MSKPVIFILGAGPKIGQSVADAFAAKGYQVAVAARSLRDETGENGYLNIKLDLTDTGAVQDAFVRVTKELGIPSVVVYNAAARASRDPKDNLSGFTLEEAQNEFSINLFSPLFAAQEAVKGFKQLPQSESKTFIFTGNALNQIVNPGTLTFAMAKTAMARLVTYASTAYQEQGYKFYYADERQADGGPTIPVNGPAAAKAYIELAEDKEQRTPLYTFVDGKGYVDFGKAEIVVHLK